MNQNTSSHISILGTRGIPASYSGFETSVQETAKRFREKGYAVKVYCRSNHFTKRPGEIYGVKLVYLPSIKNKYLDTFSHTLISAIHCLLDKVDGVILYGVGNSLFVPILRLKRIPVIAVLDGADWRRTKWNKFAQWFLKFNRSIAVRFATRYVVDSEILADEYRARFGKPPVYIPYGANSVDTFDETVLQKWNLEKRRYIIFVGRFVKEKGVDLLINSFENVNSDVKLVLIGDNALEQEYVHMLKSTKDPRIVFTGFVYGKEYESLLHFALFYVSASLLEGTSPSLLSAMTINGFALVSDLPENTEVLKGSCATFAAGDKESITQAIVQFVRDPLHIESERERTKSIVERYYNWDKISSDYLDLLQVRTSG